MGRRRLVLFAIAVVAVLAADGSAATASKGAPRSDNHRRSTTSRGKGYSDRHHHDRQNEMESFSKPRRSRMVGKGSGKLKSGGEVRSRNKRHPKTRHREDGSKRHRHSRDRGKELVLSRRNPPKASMFAGIAASLKGRAAVMQEEASGKMKEWRNIAKTTMGFSSKMEKFMIQMTWPDDGMLDNQWVEDTMKFLESTGDESPRSPNSPNKRILRKLWLRMTEQDYRTKLKALQILHHAAIDLSPEGFARVRNQYLKMRNEVNHKNRNEVYFEVRSRTEEDIPQMIPQNDPTQCGRSLIEACEVVKDCPTPARIMDVTTSGIPFLPLLQSYSAYMFRRIAEPQGSPEQLSDTLRSKKTSQAQAVALLRRLDRLICIGSKCKVDEDALNGITGQVIQLAASDVMHLWKLYVKGLKRLMKGWYKGDKQAPTEVVEQLLTHFQTTQRMLRTFLDHHEKLVQDRTDFEDNQLDSAVVEACLVPTATPERDAEQADVKEAHEAEGEQFHGDDASCELGGEASIENDDTEGIDV